MGIIKRLQIARSRKGQALKFLFGGGTIIAHTELIARKLVDGKEVERRRVVKDRVVTTAFVDYVVDNLIAEVAAFGDFKFHDSGTGTTAEAAADAQLVNDCGEARDTGTQVEGTSANIYKSVATHTYAGTFAITEHGLFNLATLAAGTLMDRTVFAAINVVSGNQIEFTFNITLTAGG